MRLLFLGDIVGRSGREIVYNKLSKLKLDLQIDGVIANAENASHGFGLSPTIAQDLFKHGVDLITLGNHSWDRKDLIPYIDKEPRIIRPLNFPPKSPGRGFHVLTVAKQKRLMIINLVGRLFMEPMDDPFRLINELLMHNTLARGVDAILVDIHAEATSEKTALAYYLDGRVSAVVGTHTHAPTSDHRVLPRGTAFQSDAGMCGDYDSVIGMQKEAAINRFVTKMPGMRFSPAEGKGTLCGLLIQINDSTGLAEKVSPLRVGGQLEETIPSWI